MMQQPVYQQEQQGSQDQGQMVLCPVRLVYETQMLVQPGDQIQPNQTILINHQNTPPWIQNRQVQNQVIYVQHVPTNYIPSHQQHIDQNQLYIQNYGYQNVPQMFVQNPQEQIRPLQMMPNMVQNMQTLPTNISAIQNQRMVSNVAPMQQQVNIVNTQNQNMNRLIAPNQINPNELINKPQEITQQVYRHQMPQTVQQEQRFPVQQTVAMVPNNAQNIQRVPQTFEPNVSQIRPMQQNIAPNIAPNIQQAYPNTIFNVDESRKVNATVNKGTNPMNHNVVHTTPAAKSLPQTYRPIQPRTHQVRNTGPNLLPMQPSTSIQAQHTMPNIISMNNVPRKIMPVPVTNVNTTLSNVKIEGNNFLFNRKRKSESPDEVHKKVSNNNQTEAPTVIKQIQNESYTMNTSADVGVNTSPIHRPSGRITINNMQITPLNPNAPNSKLIEELAKPIRNNTRSIQVPEAQNVVRNMVNIVPENVTETVPTEKEKLVRNTVYVQARGRILTDKDTIIPEPPKIEAVVKPPEPNITLPTVKPKIETIVNHPEPKVTKIETIVNHPEPKVTKIETIVNHPEPKVTKIETIVHHPEPYISMPLLNEKQPEKSQEKIKEKPEIKKEIALLMSASVKMPVKVEDSKNKVKVEVKQEKKSDITQMEPPKEVVKVKTETKPDVRVKEESLEAVKEVKEDRGYILTHVLGGFVIQESNIAFPIRKPLKEKTLFNNTEESKRENRDMKRDREFVKDNSKILDISHLNIQECENMEAEADDSKTIGEKDNPFRLLKPSEVRTWTAEQLATHLVQYNWTETVSVLQDHELDGESLLLVSKAQLVTIGVKEDHAEIICEFVKS
nr:titin-like isoform X2 [Maniola hyperantus]